MDETPTAATETNTAPLLSRQRSHDALFGRGARALTTLSVFLGLFAGRRGASMIVRESVAEQLEAWRDNWGYSLPVVVIDTIWNIAFVVLSVVMLFATATEQPNVPVRAWICVYSLQCAVHVLLVWLEYKRRNRRSRASTDGSSSSDSDQSTYGDDESQRSDVKFCETFNTIFQYIWWLIAFFLLLPKFDMHTAPSLFWLTLTFMGIDVFFAMIGFLKALITGLAVCFYFPFIMAFLYFVGSEGGASEAEINDLPKYRFVVTTELVDVGGKMVPFETNGPDFSHELVVPIEDAECCICLCSYDKGTEIHLLPCKHPFHVTCILKWLKISRFCPLCKYFITQGEQV